MSITKCFLLLLLLLLLSACTAANTNLSDGDTPTEDSDGGTVSKDGSITTADGSVISGPIYTSCAEIPNTPDGQHTLYYNRKPWTVWCVNGKEYLAVNPTRNYSQYTAGTMSPGFTVRTSYSKIRIDPATLKVDLLDRTFAASTGNLRSCGGSGYVFSMPYASAQTCDATGAPGLGMLDLTDTPFAVTPNIFMTVFKGVGGATYSANNQVVTLHVDGSPGAVTLKMDLVLVYP